MYGLLISMHMFQTYSEGLEVYFCFAMRCVNYKLSIGSIIDWPSRRIILTQRKYILI